MSSTGSRTRTPLKTPTWKSGAAQISLPANISAKQKLTVAISSPLDLSHARIVWEASDQEPAFGNNFSFTPAARDPQWIEAEAQLPDGRRVFAVTNFVAR